LLIRLCVSVKNQIRPIKRQLATVVLAIAGTFCAGPARAKGPCGVISTFADGLQPTSEIHVATTGSNSTGDGSAANPYATIAFAASQAAPGSGIRIHPGTYPGGTFLSDLHGTAEAPIWIGGVEGQPRPIINGASEGLHLVRPRFVIVHDLEVANSSGNGVNADDGGDVGDPFAAHHVIFRNLFIHNIGGTGNQDGLKLSGINDFFVLDCEITQAGGAGSGSGIDMVGCHHGLIAHCFIHDLQGSGNAVQCKGGSEDVEIRWCRMKEAGQRAVNMGGSTGFEFFRPPLSNTKPNAEARNIRVLSNIIEGATASIAFVGCVESIAANNTIITPHNWIVRILQETVSSGGFTFLPCGDNTFSNNLVYFDRSDLSTYINVGGNTAPNTFTFSHNLWYAFDNPAQSTPNLPVAEKGGIYGVNPELADPATADYHITDESPAAGAGQSPARVTGDFEGDCYLEPPSIGAFEIPAKVGDADINDDGAVDVDDLLIVINAWGLCDPPPQVCTADISPPGGDGTVDVDDLLMVINDWTVL
jgi:hypothetical protein